MATTPPPPPPAPPPNPPGAPRPKPRKKRGPPLLLMGGTQHPGPPQVLEERRHRLEVLRLGVPDQDRHPTSVGGGRGSAGSGWAGGGTEAIAAEEDAPTPSRLPARRDARTRTPVPRRSG